jgi:hypothetical protein
MGYTCCSTPTNSHTRIYTYMYYALVMFVCVQGEREVDVPLDMIRYDKERNHHGVVGGESRVELIASRVREQLWEWAKAFSKGQHTRDSLRKVFQRLDKDGSGVVSRAEMSSALVKKMRLRIDPNDLNILLDCIDVDGSGMISYDEFVDFAVSQPEGVGFTDSYSLFDSIIFINELLYVREDSFFFLFPL